MKISFVPVCIVAGLAASASGAQEVSQVTLLDGWRMPDGSYMAGIEVQLEPGWKTYWRAPGSSGIPPRFNWAGSQNVGSVQVQWPRPEIFDTYGITSIGYSNEVVFPVQIRPERVGEPIELSLDMSYGVCADICLPAQSSDALTLHQEKGPAQEIISYYMSQGAQSAQQAGVTKTTCTLSPADGYMEMKTIVSFADDVGDAMLPVFESGSDEIAITAMGSHVEGRDLVIDTVIDHYGEGAMVLDRSAIMLTLLDQWRAVELDGCAG